MHGVPGAVAVDYQGGEVFVEEVPHHFHQHVWFFIHGDRFGAFGFLFFEGAFLDLFPQGVQPVHVGCNGVFWHAFGRGANNDAAVSGHHVFEDGLEPFAFRGW